MSDTTDSITDKPEFSNQVRFFSLSKEWVSAEGEVCEVMALPRFTAVPKPSPGLLGLANWNGQVLPLIDFNRLFSPGAHSGRVVLVMPWATGMLGLVVDGVKGVYSGNTALAPDNGDFDELTARICDGWYGEAGQYLPQLRIDRLLNEPQLADLLGIED